MSSNEKLQKYFGLQVGRLDPATMEALHTLNGHKEQALSQIPTTAHPDADREALQLHQLTPGMRVQARSIHEDNPSTPYLEGVVAGKPYWSAEWDGMWWINVDQAGPEIDGRRSVIRNRPWCLGILGVTYNDNLERCLFFVCRPESKEEQA